jgi:diaminopimelate epimerase
LRFYKYHGAGNDFIIIEADDIQAEKLNAHHVVEWCKRRYGVGADGLMLFSSVHKDGIDFDMQYFNSDGSSGMMCGNGGRCIALFAYEKKGAEKKMNFRLQSKVYQAQILEDKRVILNLPNVNQVITNSDQSCFCDTGSPHHIEWVLTAIKDVDVYNHGKELRNTYGAEGCNVNFVEVIASDRIAIRTYERGVEDETHACGTGITAAAISAYHTGRVNKESIIVSAIGGELEVQFQKRDKGYTGVALIGPAQFVYEGTVEVK